MNIQFFPTPALTAPPEGRWSFCDCSQGGLAADTTAKAAAARQTCVHGSESRPGAGMWRCSRPGEPAATFCSPLTRPPLLELLPCGDTTLEACRWEEMSQDKA